MKKFLLGCMAVIGLAACSNDEVVLEKNDANAINFSVTTEGTSRADAVYCSNNIPGTFYVWADLNNNGTTQDYIVADEISYDSTSKKCTNETGTRYWPNEGSLDFYGIVNAKEDFDFSTKTVDFTVADDAASQVDFLYAVNKGTDGNGLSKTGVTMPAVAMNFQHALSQIVFKAVNSSKNLYVEITGVGVGNVYNAGTYTLPTATTTLRDVHPGSDAVTETADAPAELANSGTWAWGSNTQDKAFAVDLGSTVVVANDGTEVNLTDTEDEADFSKALIMLPQSEGPRYTYTKDSDGTITAVTDNTTGFYFTIQCKIYNVAGDEFNPATDVCLWDGSEDIHVPATIKWYEGYKYIYTFKFGDGNGGVTPGPDPEPVLVPITFDVNVEEFQPVNAGSSDVNL